ncbi:MAG: hypothetical protein M3R36_19015 [Bacteroidota bacterium]|nr:hypothetical protein [Bacteroidota bacterium]
MNIKFFFYLLCSALVALKLLSFITYINAGSNYKKIIPEFSSDTIYSLKDVSVDKAIYKSPAGNYYKVYLDTSPDTASSMYKSRASLDCSSDNFHGSSRKKVKTSIADIATDDYSNLNEFLITLPRDSFMINYNPRISQSENSKRVFEEKRNVKILRTFIYAIKREPDNDYHIIIGNLPDNNVYLNIENTGLPGGRSKYYRKLKNVRKKFEDKFGELCRTSYLRFNPPVPIQINGSLFYDVEHRPGVVGPAGLKPQTSWEIHPVTNVVFED